MIDMRISLEKEKSIIKLITDYRKRHGMVAIKDRVITNIIRVGQLDLRKDLRKFDNSFAEISIRKQRLLLSVL